MKDYLGPNGLLDDDLTKKIKIKYFIANCEQTEQILFGYVFIRTRFCPHSVVIWGWVMANRSNRTPTGYFFTVLDQVSQHNALLWPSGSAILSCQACLISCLLSCRFLRHRNPSNRSLI